MIRATVLVREGAVVTSNGDAADVPWWSFTKTVIAAAALALVRDGRPRRSTSTLPDRPYTLRQLLQHRAGLTEYGRLRRLSRGRRAKRRRLAR